MSNFDLETERQAEKVFLALMQGNFQEALVTANDYLTKGVQHPYFVFAASVSHLLNNNAAEFRRCFDIIQKSPDVNHADLYNFGLFFQKNEVYPFAIECFAGCVEREATFRDGYVQLGNALLAAGEHEAAVGAFTAAVEKKEDDADSHFKIGHCMEHLDRSEKALEHYRKAYEIEPEASDTRSAIAGCLIKLNRRSEACDFLLAGEQEEREQKLLYKLYSEGIGLSKGQKRKVAKALGQALPQAIWREAAIGRILRVGVAVSRVPIALLNASWRGARMLGMTKPPRILVDVITVPFIALEIVSQYIVWPFGLLPESDDRSRGPFPVFGGRGLALIIRLFRGREAAAQIIDSAVQIYHRLGWADRAEDLARRNYEALPTTDRGDILIRMLLSSSRDSREELYSRSVENSVSYSKKGNLLDPAQKNLSEDKRLKVGLMCDFFHGQIAYFTLKPQLEALDEEEVCVYLYDSNPAPWADTYPDQEIRDVKGMSDEELAKLVRDDDIDILIELNGRLRANNRLGVFAYRPAPVQVSWYNLPATSGMPEIDWVITDEVSVPTSEDRYYTEQVLRLEGGATGGWELTDEPDIVPAPVVREGVFTFGSFGDTFKTNPKVIETWAEILRRVPNSRLFLKAEMLYRPLPRLFLLRQFAKLGVSPDRIFLEGFSPYHVMRQRYGAMDLALDTFPYSGGSTTMNALWQGVPTLTLAGPDWRGRTTTSILTSAGLEEFVCGSREEYVERAVALAEDPTRLVELRTSMRDRLSERSRYFQIGHYAEDFEAGMRTMWEAYVARQSESPSEGASEPTSSVAQE